MATKVPKRENIEMYRVGIQWPLSFPFSVMTGHSSLGDHSEVWRRPGPGGPSSLWAKLTTKTATTKAASGKAITTFHRAIMSMRIRVSSALI